ncbi:MAG: mhpA, partial [Conexibacter sp.]|nr:mhpA [Conexibacter sp.]
PAGHVERLDEAIGDGFALLAVDVPEPAIPAGALWRRLDPRLVAVILDDRFPEDTPLRSVADFDGGLRAALAPVAGHYVLVRPDRYVAAVFAPEGAAAVGQALAPAWGCPRSGDPAPAAAR